jgi:predicted DNA-binding transcriptional regulator YafY
MNKKNITAKELSEHFEVSSRTIYRDIEILCQAGIPIYTNKGKGGGISLLDHFVLNKSVLTEQEQVEILSALQGLNAASYSDTNQVISKLSSLFGTVQNNWIEVDFSSWNHNEEDKSKFYLLKEAILNSKVIEFSYYNSYGEASSRVVEPIRLIFKGQSWYLYGFCRDKKDYRFFKITRIKELQKSEESFHAADLSRLVEKPIEKKLPYLNKLITIKLKIDADMAYRVYDEFEQDAISKNEDGSFLVTIQMQDGGWLYGYLLSYEDHIEVLEPQEIRNTLIIKMQNALNKYQNNPII